MTRRLRRPQRRPDRPAPRRRGSAPARTAAPTRSVTSLRARIAPWRVPTALHQRVAHVELEDRLWRRRRGSGAPAGARARDQSPGRRQPGRRGCRSGAARRARPRPARRARPSPRRSRVASSTAPGLAASVLRGAASSSSGTRPKSTSPWLSDLSGLPSKSCGIMVQNASTGSVSSSTSMPRARAASSLGLDLQPLDALADQVIDLGLVGPQIGDVLLERARARRWWW